MTQQSKTILVVQARMSSTRLPGKVMAEIAGKPAIQLLLDRVSRAKRVDEFWMACSDTRADDPLVEFVSALGHKVFRGSEADVLGRFVALVRQVDAGTIVRITGDCPLVDPDIVDQVLELHAASGADFTSNTLARSFPDGLDVEVFSRAALEEADQKAKDPFLRGHVTPYIHGRLADRFPCGDFRREQLIFSADFSHLRWTLDEEDDLQFFRRLVPHLKPDFGWLDVVAELTRRPEILHVNGGHSINEGTAREIDGSNQPRQFAASNAYFERASKTIPLASQTFSKSYQQWVRGASPLFIDRARGARLIDMDGNGYIDYVLGLLPIILGYRDPDVDLAIMRQIDKGIVFPLASPLEAELAETLVRLIPCAEMVRFGKNGSDATSAAVRLARAHTGRDRVAVCGGYHGWHDWYIGTTTRDLGVPDSVKALSRKLPFNDLDALEALFRDNGSQYAAVILEPDGAVAPKPGYLTGVRQLCDKYGVVLIFDEIIAGFRMHLGGAQAYHGVTPDLACFGKAIANGMPLSAIVGRAHIMKHMENIFFSATFGGEALSLAAAIATLKKLETENVVPRLWKLGETLRDSVNKVAQDTGLGEMVRFAGQGWWPRLHLNPGSFPANLVNSLLRQEFNANGLLLGASLNLCLAHDNPSVVTETLAAVEKSLRAVRSALDSRDPAAHLRGEPVQPTFTVR